MAKIHINNPKQVINGGAKKYYFKVKGLGGPKGDKGDKGDTGATGPQGPQGNAATVSIGSTTTLPVGYDATVTNSGSIYNAVLNFGIPQGPRGPQGAKGDKGDTGAQGETGPRGPQGEKGTNATVYVGTTSTLAPGSQATVYNSGSDSNAVLNFGIPQGAKGDIGNTGPQGPAGQNFAPTVVAELPATGDESKLYLTPKAHTTSTATGNPITATVSEDAGAIESFKLDGNTEQAAYTGINLARNAYKKETVSGVTFTASADGSITANGTATDRIDYYIYSSARFSLSAGTYVLSTGGSDGTSETYFVYVDNTTGQNWSSRADQSNTITSSSNFEASVRIVVRSGVVLNNVVFKIQIEAGSTPSSYQPYVGGTPSPNPSYPQPIQTVTGLQTISINGTDYPLDLGDIQLCKIEGQAQPLVFDCIYPDGENWKLHKAIAKQIVIGSEIRLKSNYTNVQFAVVPKPRDSRLYGNYTAIFIYNDHAIYRYNSGGWNNSDLDHGVFTTPLETEYWFGYKKGTSLETMQQELDGAVTYYALATATDTTITDTTLIAQLEAIRTALLQNGANTITNTATAPNLAGDMEIGYYGFNPTNRYDKFIWLNLNNNYEQIGGE